MRFPNLLRATCIAAVCFWPIVRAAELVEEEENTAQAGQLKDKGTRHAKPEINPASDEGQLALKRMNLPPGIEAKLWAAEPMLANPVAFNFDERGRIFVAETYRYRSSVLDIRDYMWMLEDDLAARTIEDRARLIEQRLGADGAKELAQEGEILRLLEDSDGDGVADKSAIYADGFNTPLDGIASGVLIRRGKVWFTNIPSVWMFTGAQRAESRTEISRGYGVRFNYTGHDLHGLVFGPDGKIYFSNGDRGATLRTKEGATISVADTGAVFRCNPDGSELELVAWGLRNPQSLVFTENGDLFTGDNDCDHGDEERLVHVVEGGDSGWRVGYQFAPREKAGAWNDEKLWWQRHEGQPAYLLPPICNVEDGPSGLTYYPGTGLNPTYAGHLFITHFKGAIARSGIYTYTLKPDGAGHKIADSKPFLTSALPTDVRFGPDGKLYASDWAEGWSKSKRGRIYAIYDPKHVNDPLIKETQQLIGGDWTKRPTEELTQLLGHADWRVRLEAQFTLAERGAACIPVFAQVATSAGRVSGPPSSTHARLHAIWGLGQLAAKNREALAPLRSLLTDRDAEVRAQAIKILGDRRSVNDADHMVAALKDPSNRVKFFAAQSLGKFKHAPAAAALLDALRANNDEDNYLRHALVMGLVGGNNLERLTAAISAESRAVRLGALLALRRLARPEIAKFLADPDPYLVREAALAINDQPINEALPALAALVGQASDLPYGKDKAIMLRALNAQFRLGKAENAATLAHYAARADAPASLRAEAVAQLANWPKPPARDRIVGVYRPLGEKTRERAVALRLLEPIAPSLLAPTTPSVVQTAALEALQSLEAAGAAEALLGVVSDERQSTETRAAALSALDKMKHSRLAEAVEVAGASSSSSLRLAALPIAARLSPEAAAPIVRHLIVKGDFKEKKTAFRALGTLKHPTAEALLLEQLRELDAGTVPAAIQLELLNAAGRRSEPAIKDLLAKRETALASNPDPLAPYRFALAGGDAARGKRVFETQPTLACIRCHRAGGTGGDAGPDLAQIGAKHTREYLLESILKPNAKIAPGFDTIVLTLKAGGVAAGTLAEETADSVMLRNTENKVVTVKKTDIAKRESAPSSMPEIYGAILSKAQLRDVVEYLATLTDKPARIEDTRPRALRGYPPPPKTSE